MKGENAVADITMCRGVLEKKLSTRAVDDSHALLKRPDGETKPCPVRDKCYRYTALANPHWQSYFVNVPMDWDSEECNQFMSDVV